MPENKHNNFLSKIRFILGNRDEYPWGQSIGLKRGTIHRIFVEGEVVGPEFLKAISRAESVSLDWLLLDRGTPFFVYHAYSDGETAELAEFVSDYPLSWIVHFMHDESRHSLVLRRVDQFDVKGDLVDYDRTEVIVGPVGPQTLDALRRHGILQIREVILSAATMDRLIGGEVGSFELTREDGLLERYKPLNLMNGFDIGEPAAGYVLEPDERILLEKYRRLKPADKTRVIAIGDALGEVERQELEDS